VRLVEGQNRSALVVELEFVRTRAAQLERALASRIVIEQAKGVLRERFGWSIEEAFAVLRLAARSSRLPLRTVARGVVESEDTPNAVLVAMAKSARWRATHMRERAEAQRERARELDARLRAVQGRLARETRSARQLAPTERRT
jgi:ANTAR domain-containing protein